MYSRPHQLLKGKPGYRPALVITFGLAPCKYMPNSPGETCRPAQFTGFFLEKIGA
jgi:hypothetical protein